jgi:hypothetical protein
VAVEPEQTGVDPEHHSRRSKSQENCTSWRGQENKIGAGFSTFARAKRFGGHTRDLR